MKNLFVILCVLMSMSVHAQHKKNWEELGDKSFNRGDYYGASIYYDNARVKDPTNLPLIEKLAKSLRLNSDYVKAENYYKYLALKGGKDNYPEAFYWQASMEKYNAKYGSAINTWQKVKQIYAADTNAFEYKKAVQELQSCEFARRYAKAYVPIEIQNLGKHVNSTEAEFGTWLQDDTLLYFSSLRGLINEEQQVINAEDYFIKIYRAVKQKGNWVNQGAMDSIINVAHYHTGNGSFAKQGNAFYFSRCDLNLRCDLYKTEIKDYAWQPAKPITELNSNNYTSTQPIITQIKEVEIIFFVSDRPGGYGKNDIWFAIKKDANQYTKPINLGPQINTPGNEISPFYDQTDSTLYFSSDWHEGFGGFDVFSTKFDIENPGTVYNMGQPLNTSVNDFYFSVFGNEGFLTSNRPGSITEKGLTCCNDLFQVTFVDRKKKDFLDNHNHGLNGVEKNNNQDNQTNQAQGTTDGNLTEEQVHNQAVDKELTTLDKLNNLLPLSMYFDNDYPDPKTMSDTTNWVYDSLLINYKLKETLFVKKSGKGLRGDNKVKAREQMQSFFDLHVNDSEKKLDKFFEWISELLRDGNQLEIVLRGYASPLANEDYNFLLTKRRIVSFKNLITNFQGGVLKPYLTNTAENKGFLKINALPFGEKMSLLTVSDNLYDKTNSVYSAAASLERKIDIVAVVDASEQELMPKLKLDLLTQDLGVLKQGETKSIQFSFTNMGDSPLVIKNVEPECGCTVPKLEKTVYQPGERGHIAVYYTNNNRLGTIFKTLTLTTNEKEGKHLLVIFGEVK